MNDAFATLGLRRRPWLDPEVLRRDFLAQSGPTHPDRFHSAGVEERDAAGARYSELNAAHQTLKDARTRLAHLIELETGAPPRDIQRLPPGSMELFSEIGQTCRDVDGYLQKRAAAASPMLQVGLLRELPVWFDRLGGLKQRVATRTAQIDAELLAMNEVWESAPPPGDPARLRALPLDRLEQCYRAASYAARWSAQIQDRMAALAG